MSSPSRWLDVRWKASVFTISHLFKLHSIPVLSVILLKLFTIYVFKILRIGKGLDSRFLGVYRVCINGLMSYAALFFTLKTRQMSFRGSTKTDIFNEVISATSVLSSMLTIAILSCLLFRVYIRKFHLLLILIAVTLHQVKLRRQRCDIIRALNREAIAAPMMCTFISTSALHVTFSILIAIGASAVMQFACWILAAMSETSRSVSWNYVEYLDQMLSTLPGMRKYTGNIYGADSTSIFLSTIWVISLTEAFYEHMNCQMSHMDPIIVNSVETYPSHGSTEYEDELTIARAFLNYSRGVSMVLNNVKKRFEPNGNAMNISVAEDPRKCPMVPFSNVNQGSSYNLDAQRKRYQVDAVVYRMLVDSDGKLLSSYVEAFLESLIEAEGHIVAFSNQSQSTSNMLIDLKRDGESSDSYNNWLQFILSFLPGMSFKVPHKAMDTIVIATVYIQGLANWLCIANMLGYNGNEIQQISKEFVSQCVSLSKAVSTVRRYKTPTNFSSTLDALTNVVNVSLKQMSVYADYLLYSSFDTDFDTFCLVEKMYKTNPQSAAA